MATLGDLATALNNIAANLGKLIANTSLSIVVPIVQGGTGATTAAGARTNLGLGTMATQNANAVAVTGGTIDGPSTIRSGQSGTAGKFGVYPATALRGRTEFTANDNAGDTLTTIVTASQAGARTYTVPDQGGNASYLLTGAALQTSGVAGALRLPLTRCVNPDGTGLAAAASAGLFGISLTAGTDEYLITEAANTNTKTDVVVVECDLPPNYIAAKDLTLTVNCNYTLGTGTLGTHTIDASAYLGASNGTFGADIVATAAQNIPAAAGDVAFTLTGTSLSPGDRLLLALTMVVQETGGTGNITARLNSLRLS